jgi:hypothetical protein
MTITPELRQNIFYTVYFTVTHNLPVFFYGFGIISFALLAILRPRRSFILLLLGFIILLFAFEYNKHILEGLKEQTINALITIQEHNLVRRIINLVLVRLLPIGMPFVGWLLVFGGGFLYWKGEKER